MQDGKRRANTEHGDTLHITSLRLSSKCCVIELARPRQLHILRDMIREQLGKHREKLGKHYTLPTLRFDDNPSITLSIYRCCDIYTSEYRDKLN